MKVSQMKSWLNSLPEEFDEYPVCIMQNISPIENSVNNSYIIKERQITLCLINDMMKKAFVLDYETEGKFHKCVDKTDMQGDIPSIEN